MSAAPLTVWCLEVRTEEGGAPWILLFQSERGARAGWGTFRTEYDVEDGNWKEVEAGEFDFDGECPYWQFCVEEMTVAPDPAPARKGRRS